MSGYIGEAEARERCADRLRRHGSDAATARRVADQVVGKVVDNKSREPRAKRAPEHPRE